MVTDVLCHRGKYAAPSPVQCEKNHIQPVNVGPFPEITPAPYPAPVNPREYRHDAQIYHCGRHPPRQSSVGIRLLTALAASAPARAELATPEQKKACTPDVYRLCAGEIPNARAITACLRRQKANVSEAGRAVFEQ